MTATNERGVEKEAHEVNGDGHHTDNQVRSKGFSRVKLFWSRHEGVANSRHFLQPNVHIHR